MSLLRDAKVRALRVFATLIVAAPMVAHAQPDVDAALAAVRDKATAGDVIAQFSLGAMLYYGADDLPQAITWLRNAAEQHHPPAEFQLGQLYDFGFGVTRSEEQALAWYRLAAEHGSGAGQRAVGEIYQKGRGVASNPSEAARWYRRAADRDDLRAQYLLGEMYFTGTGVPQDYSSAYVWYSLAASQAPLLDNRKGLLELRNIAAARMTPEQVADAARRVAMWTATSRDD